MSKTSAEQAKELGLEYVGFGYWEDSTGKVVAKTINGVLTKIEDEKDPDKRKWLEHYGKIAQQRKYVRELQLQKFDEIVGFGTAKDIIGKELVRIAQFKYKKHPLQLFGTDLEDVFREVTNSFERKISTKTHSLKGLVGMVAISTQLKLIKAQVKYIQNKYSIPKMVHV
jgi:hypothetical protein